jgi:hypothetical protein
VLLLKADATAVMPSGDTGLQPGPPHDRFRRAPNRKR